jgi:hypothetical protein
MNKPTRLRPLRRRTLLFATGSLIATPAIVRAQGRNGVALVIGNSKYKFESALPNAKRDVQDVAKAFEALGLKTELAEDLGRDALKPAIERLGALARNANFTALYFAGHGAWWKGTTHLVPVDTDLTEPERAIPELMSMVDVGKALSGAKAGMAILDNCRNSPMGGWRQRAARLDAALTRDNAKAALRGFRNGLLMFSTQPGCVALDGPAGQKSPFATAFIQELAGSSIDLQAFPGKVRRRVLLATEGQQLIWDAETFDQSFSLTTTGKPPAAGSGSAHDPSRVIELDNTYAFAQQHGLLLPSGMVAYRPPAGSPDMQKVGTYKAEINASQNVFIVLCAPDADSAEFIFAGKAKIAGEWQPYWRFVTAKTGGNTLTFKYADGSGGHIDWRDRNSGTITMESFVQAGKQFRITRLDG